MLNMCNIDIQIYFCNICMKHLQYYCKIFETYKILRNVEYSTLLVMSELSTVRCDRALGLWIAGTRASSVDGELPWRYCGR